MFGPRQLRQLLNPSLAQRTAENAELVLAYLQYGGCTDTCLTCLTQLPVLENKLDQVIAACAAPFTPAKIACVCRYLAIPNAPKLVVEQMAFALRFQPELAEMLLQAIAKIAPPNDVGIMAQVLRCLYRPYDGATRMAAAQATYALCTDATWLAPHALALAELVPYGETAVRILRLMPEHAACALPQLVERGPMCAASVALVHAIAELEPLAVVQQGGLTMLMLAGYSNVPCAIIELYTYEDITPTGANEALAYMCCRMELPETGVHDVMRFVMDHEQPGVRAIFADAYDMARTQQSIPTTPSLPDFDTELVGTITLVPADSNTVKTTLLLAPVARAAAYIAAHVRQHPNQDIAVPIRSKYMEPFLRALLYDDIPHDDALALAVLAEIANMWCAPRLLHLCIEVLTTLIPFWDLFNLAGNWPQAQEQMRYLAMEYLPDIAQDTRITELSDILWTCT